MSQFEQALEQVRRAHREDLELPKDLHEALELQARVQKHVHELVNAQ